MTTNTTTLFCAKGYRRVCARSLLPISVRKGTQDYNQICIFIRSELGADVSFKRDSFWCTLHFRRQSTSL